MTFVKLLLSILTFSLMSCVSGPKFKSVDFEMPPKLAESSSAKPIYLGGFSGLNYLGTDEQGNYHFITHTDRGPNGDPVTSKKGMLRPFLLPDFSPKLVEFTVHKDFNAAPKITRVSPLRGSDKALMSGLPNDAHLLDKSSNVEETPIDEKQKVLAFNALGIDPEGIAMTPQGDFWMVEEYGPSILHFDSSGTLLERYSPKGSTSSHALNHNTLPEIYRHRPTNRGFEAVAYDNGKLYAFLQSPIKKEGANFTRILEFDTVTKTVSGEYFYPLDPGADHKIGDAAVVGPKDLLVLENYFLPYTKTRRYFIQRIRLDKLGHDNPTNKNIPTVQKTMFIDLSSLGYIKDKPEGLAVLPDQKVMVLNDNDFNVAHFFNKALSQNVESGISLMIIDFPAP